MSKDEAKNYFNPIDDERIADRYLGYIEDLNATLNCSIRNTELRFEAKPTAGVKNRVMKLRPNAAVAEYKKLQQLLNEAGSNEMDFNYKAQDILIFVTAKVTKIDDLGISLLIDYPIFKLQRRENLRVCPEPTVKCEVSITKTGLLVPLKVRPFDISLGGFSVVVNQADKKVFKIDDEVRGIRLNFMENTNLIAAKVVNVIELKNKTRQEFKIGFSLIDELPPQLEQDIIRYAYDVSQRQTNRQI